MDLTVKTVMRHACSIFNICLLLCVIPLCVSAETYYVIPTTANTSVCPEDSHSPCMTLSQYANTSIGYFASNTTLILLPGNHSLDFDLTIENITSLTIQAEVGSTRVSCSPAFGIHFAFQDIDLLQMYGIIFIGCTSNVMYVEQFSLEQCELRGSTFGSKLELIFVDFVTVSHSYFTMNRLTGSDANDGIFDGILLLESIAYASITDSSFDNNHAGCDHSCVNVQNVSLVVVHDSNFTNNTAAYFGSAIQVAEASSIFINGSSFTGNFIKQSDNVPLPFAGGGAVSVYNQSELRAFNSIFVNNLVEILNVTTLGGAISVSLNSTATIDDCHFMGNRASHSGGAIWVGLESALALSNSHFVNNLASTKIYLSPSGGGACLVYLSNVSIENCTFRNNRAEVYGGGGAVSLYGGFSSIKDSTFDDNFAIFSGGALTAVSNEVSSIINCTFVNNTAEGGGAVFCANCILNIESCSFDSNTALKYAGGAIVIECSLSFGCGGEIENSTFIGNNARLLGGAAVSIFSGVLTTKGSVQFEANEGKQLGVFLIAYSDVKFLGHTLFLNNTRSPCVIYYSDVTFNGYTTFFDNSFEISTPSEYNAGTLSFYLSSGKLNGVMTISDNTVMDGGGILAIQSTIDTTGKLVISNNHALRTGGGIYTYQTEFGIMGSVSIFNNTAVQSGGGIHALGAAINLAKGSLSLMKNNAYNGGGIYLESNAKLYLTKLEPEFKQLPTSLQGNMQFSDVEFLSLEFTDNSAVYGGAIFVDDDTASNICSNSAYGECFFQVLSLYDFTGFFSLIPTIIEENLLNLENVHFINNSAEEAGDSLFGGLLDRCSLSPFAEVLLGIPLFREPIYFNPVLLFNATTNVEIQDISSAPVRICFCQNKQPDCSYQPPPVGVRKGGSFNIELVAVDQVNQTVPSFIGASVVPWDTTLDGGQAFQESEIICTRLTYNLNAPIGIDNSTISIFAYGPCVDMGISSRSIVVEFLECPIGFSEMSSGCDCDPVLHEYIVNCSVDLQSVLKEGDVWISVANVASQTEYLASQNCPFDYCLSSPNILVNLSAPSGPDEQCAFNRSGILCGQCAQNLSLVLGSSRCKMCSDNGLALLIFFTFIGIALVTFILACNLTVAVGTINGLIFYANIVTVNHATFFLPKINGNILNIFIAWVNLDFGIEACFYDGMDSYAQTWLQLVFPSYIILLVVVIMLICKYSQRFSMILSTKNPVATLATLILLSYTKVLRLIIAGISYSRVSHFNSESQSTHFVWRVDASVPYLGQKHLPLFIVILFVALVCSVFTLLLLFWQCLYRCPIKRFRRWMSSPRINSFVDAFHAPLKNQHRYWPGFMLLVRIALYVVITAVNVFDDPEVNLWSITLAVGIMLVLNSISHGGAYKQNSLNILENSFIINLLLLTTSTSFFRQTGRNLSAITYTSISVAFITFLLILLYHSYVYLLLTVSPIHKILRKCRSLFHRRRTDEQVNARIQRITTAKHQSNRISVVDFSNFRGPLNSIVMDQRFEEMEYSNYQPEASKPVPVGTTRRVHVVTHGTINGIPYSEGECIEEQTTTT